MNFRTEIKLQKEYDQINYKSELLLIGSCFSENIYTKFNYFKFKAFHNPFGILFHPKAIEKLISNVFEKKIYTSKDVFELNERWHCFDAHSNLSDSNKEELINQLNSTITFTNQKLSLATHVIITLGTAWIYRHIESQNIVANCHKVPQNNFSKELLSIDEISNSLDNIIRHLQKFNPKMNIVFTVSPVRHLKDGFLENSQSKAHLLAAIHKVISSNISGGNNFYFPSYEIMLDDLRDYRFYKSDMLHPNQSAIDYIWELFKGVWINDNTLSIIKEVDIVQKGLSHKPFNKNSLSHQQFLAKLQVKIQDLKDQHNISF
jgi:hypothetical protein